MKFEITSQHNDILTKTHIEATNFDTLKSSNQLPKNVIKIKQIDKKLFQIKPKTKYNRNQELTFISELDMLLKVKIPFFESITILSQNTPHKQIQEISQKLAKHISTGKNFENFFENNETFLSQLSILFFKLSDISGNISANINSLHEILNEQNEQKTKITEALSYPIFLFVVMIIAISVIFGFVVPQFQNMLQNSHEIPTLTKFVFWASQNYMILVTTFFAIITSIFLALNLKKISNNKKLHLAIDNFLISKLPIVRAIILTHNMQIWFLVLKEQISSKHKLHDALQFSKIAISNYKFQNEITSLINGLNFGNSLSHTMKNSNFFDNITINLIQVAEETNDYETVFGQLHSINKTKLNGKIKLFTLFFEPIFAITIAAILLIVALGIFIPIWDFANITKF